RLGRGAAFGVMTGAAALAYGTCVLVRAQLRSPVEPLHAWLAVLVFGIVGLAGANAFARRIVERYAGEDVAGQLVTTGGIRTQAPAAAVVVADGRRYTAPPDRRSPPD